jgi:hypothetical protein
LHKSKIPQSKILSSKILSLEIVNSQDFCKRSIVVIPYVWLLEEPTAKADVIPKPPVKTRPKPLPPNPTPPPIAQPDLVQNYENTTIVQNTTNNQIFITNNTLAKLREFNCCRNIVNTTKRSKLGKNLG